MSFLTFSSIHVFRPEGQIWDPVRCDTKTYVRRILNTPCMQAFINAHVARFRYYGAKLIVDTIHSQSFINLISELYQAVSSMKILFVSSLKHGYTIIVASNRI